VIDSTPPSLKRELRRLILGEVDRLQEAKERLDETLVRSAEQLLTGPVFSAEELRRKLAQIRFKKIKRFPEDACRRLVVDICKIMDVYDVAALPSAVRRTTDILHDLTDVQTRDYMSI
jgi:hypothetical protein